MTDRQTSNCNPHHVEEPMFDYIILTIVIDTRLKKTSNIDK